MAEFANSLLVIPKTLSVNAALDSSDLVSKLRAFHNASQTMPEREGLKWWIEVDTIIGILLTDICFSIRYGLDLVGGALRDSKNAGVLEPVTSKLKSLKFATEAAITILRIDDMIKLAPEEKDDNTYQNARARGALWNSHYLVIKILFNMVQKDIISGYV